MIWLGIKESLQKEKKNYSLIFIYAVFAFWCGTDITASQEVGIGLGEFVLTCLANHYYIVYCFFMYSLYWIFKDIREERDVELIRYGSYDKVYTIKSLAALVKITIFVLGHIVIAAGIGFMSFEKTFGFKGVAIQGYYNEVLEMVLKFGTHFNTTVEAIVLSALFLILGTFFSYQLLFYCHKLKGDKITIIFMIYIILSMFIGFKYGLDSRIFTQGLFINNYLILHHVMFDFGKLVVCLNIIVVLVASILLKNIVVGIKKGNSRQNKLRSEYINSMMSNYRIMYVYIVVLIGLKTIQILYTGCEAWDYLLLNVCGFSYESFNVLDVLYYLAYFIFPIYIICCFLENEKQDKNILAKVRYGSKNIWENNILSISIKYLLTYYISYLGILGIGTLTIELFNWNKEPDLWFLYIEEYAIDHILLIKYICVVIVMKFIELVLLFEVVYLVQTITRKTIVAFLVPFAGYFITLCIGKMNKYNVCGSSSLLNLVSIGKDNIIITVIVAVVLIIVLEIARRSYCGYSNKIRKC